MQEEGKGRERHVKQVLCTVFSACQGVLRRHGTPTKRKSPLTTAQLQLITMQFVASDDHDDKLFITMLNTGYTGLLRLAEMTMHDNPNLRNFKKVTLHNSIHWLDGDFDFFLPTHKSDIAFEGNRVYIKQILNVPNPSPLMQRYLESRDFCFPLHPHLWLTSHGVVPTRQWFISRLQKHCPPDIAGQSLRAGRATAMAEAGSPGPLIQGTGRWSSTTFQTYIQRNPIVLHALIMGCTLHFAHAVS
jgi:hypothetical protein